MWRVTSTVTVRSRWIQLLGILLSLPSFSSPSISVSHTETSEPELLLLSHLWSTLTLHILNFHTSPHTHHPTHLACRAVNFVYDSTATPNHNHYPLPSPPTLPTTNLILNLSRGGVTLKQEVRLHRPCSLLLLQVHVHVHPSSSPSREETEINMSHFASWSNFLGSPHHIFFLFLATAPASTPSTLLDFSRKTRQVHQAVFALLDSSSLRVFRRTTLMTRLVPLGSYPLDIKTVEIGNFFRDQPTDFEGDVMAVKVCPICAPALDDFKTTGVWTDYMIATMWEVSLDFNATLEAESVFSLPGDGRSADGDWDGFMQPLVEGSAVMSAIIRPTPDNIKQVYISAAGTYFDSVSFVTALPTKIPYTSLLRLLHPFSPLLWLAIIISILTIFTLLQVILQFRWGVQISRYISKRARRTSRSRKGKRMSEWELELVRRSTPRHAPINTIIALLKPIVDQSGLASKKFVGSIGDGLSRFTIGMWFLLLISLGCAYKSKVIEMLVHPHFDEPPITFAMLLDSDYDIGALFYVGLIQNDFNAMNNSLSRRLDPRVTEYPYHESTCYERIFEGRRACLGFREIFQTVGAKFMTDVRKRQMFRRSTDAFFFVQATIAVSKFYPQVIQPFSWIMSRFVVTGLVNKIYQRSRDRLKREGQQFALNAVARSPAYSGSKWHEEEDDFGKSMWQITHLLIQLILLGAAGATVAFLFEMALHLYHLHVKVKTETTTPVKIFINEFPQQI